MLNINKAPFIVGVLNPKFFDNEINYLINNQPDVVEYRADLNDVINIDTIKTHLKKISGELALPLLFTLRDKSEGGNFSGTDEQRNIIYYETLDFVDAIDIESSLAEFSNNVIKTAHSKNIKVVLSYHNFEKTPELSSLYKTVDKCFDGGADITKIATMCETKEEAEQLISLTVKYNNIATVGMGKYGPLTRISAPTLGSILTYAFTDSKEIPVPGQFTIGELKTAWKSAGIRVN